MGLMTVRISFQQAPIIILLSHPVNIVVLYDICRIISVSVLFLYLLSEIPILFYVAKKFVVFLFLI